MLEMDRIHVKKRDGRKEGRKEGGGTERNYF